MENQYNRKTRIYSSIGSAPANAPERRVSPVGGLVILQELAPDVPASVQSRDNGIQDPGRTIHDIEGRMEPMLRHLPRRDLSGIFVRNPTRVHTVHVNAIALIIRRRGAGHHV